jgi:hypothetical protein
VKIDLVADARARLEHGRPLSTAHIQAWLGICGRTVRRRVARKELPEPRRVNSRVLLWDASLIKPYLTGEEAA